MQAVYVADSEARLRHELEEKGLLVLAIRTRTPSGCRRCRACRSRGVATVQASREFLVFNQELATLLKAGMPLVQSLDILRRSVPNPTFKAVLDDVHERVRSGTALSEAFERHARPLSEASTPASLMAGEKSGNLDQMLRRFIAYVKIIGSVRSKMTPRLMCSRSSSLLSATVVAIIVIRVVPALCEFYAGVRRAAALDHACCSPDSRPRFPRTSCGSPSSAAAWGGACGAG